MHVVPAKAKCDRWTARQPMDRWTEWSLYGPLLHWRQNKKVYRSTEEQSIHKRNGFPIQWRNDILTLHALLWPDNVYVICMACLMPQWISFLVVFGSLIEQSPPNTSNADTKIMGIEQWMSTNSPNIRLPQMAAIRAIPVWMPNAVDLKI